MASTATSIETGEEKKQRRDQQLQKIIGQVEERIKSEEERVRTFRDVLEKIKAKDLGPENAKQKEEILKKVRELLSESELEEQGLSANRLRLIELRKRIAQ